MHHFSDKQCWPSYQGTLHAAQTFVGRQSEERFIMPETLQSRGHWSVKHTVKVPLGEQWIDCTAEHRWKKKKKKQQKLLAPKSLNTIYLFIFCENVKHPIMIIRLLKLQTLINAQKQPVLDVREPKINK